MYGLEELVYLTHFGAYNVFIGQMLMSNEFKFSTLNS